MNADQKILSPDGIRKNCLRLAQTRIATYDDKKWGAIIGHFTTALKCYTQDGKDRIDENRRLVMGFLFANEDRVFTPLHAPELTPSQRFAIGRWVGATLDEASGKWLPRKMWANECYWVLSVAIWINTLTLWHEKPPTFGELYAGYLVEQKEQDVLSPEYWTNMALSLGGVVTDVYEKKPFAGIKRAAFPLPAKEILPKISSGDLPVQDETKPDWQKQIEETGFPY